MEISLDKPWDNQRSWTKGNSLKDKVIKVMEVVPRQAPQPTMKWTCRISSLNWLQIWVPTEKQSRRLTSRSIKYPSCRQLKRQKKKRVKRLRARWRIHMRRSSVLDIVSFQRSLSHRITMPTHSPQRKEVPFLLYTTDSLQSMAHHRCRKWALLTTNLIGIKRINNRFQILDHLMKTSKDVQLIHITSSSTRTETNLWIV